MIRIILISFFLLCTVAPAPSQDGSGPAWPPPPERARIRHTRTIDARTGLGRETGFFGKILGTLFGGKRMDAWLVQPVGIAVSPEGAIFVADPGAHAVHVVDPRENRYEIIPETKFGAFESPVGVAVGGDGLIYVSDTERGDVVVMDGDGDGERLIKGPLVRPTGVHVSGDTLYVTDTGVHRVFLLSTEGELLGSFGGRGAGTSEFNFPVAVAVRESVYVLDGLNYRVQAFGRAGGFAGAFGEIGNVAGRFAAPKGIALDSDGDIYVTDALMDNVQIFDRTGRLLLIFGRNGDGDGEFSAPGGIAIGPDDSIYVVDSINRRIQIFRYYR